MGFDVAVSLAASVNLVGDAWVESLVKCNSLVLLWIDLF